MGSLAAFYAPIAVSYFLTIITHSLFNAGIARLPSPEIYLAAFAVARSLMHMFEGPMMMFSQTVAALVEDRSSYRRVRIFVLVWLAATVSLLAFFAVTALGRAVFVHVMDLRGETLEAAVAILRVFVVFPCVSTLKFFMQGVIIRLEATTLLTMATVIRIAYVGLFILNIDRLLFLPAPVVAGVMFASALGVEGVLLYLGTRLAAGPFPKAIENRPRPRTQAGSLTYKSIFGFFFPLAVTSLIRTMGPPVINMGLARTGQPELALSAFAVAWGLAMIVMSPTIMFHQVTLSFSGSRTPQRMAVLRRFALLVGIAMSVTMAALSFSDGALYILTRWIQASEPVSRMAVDVLRLASLLPLLMIGREYFWGLLARHRLTKYLGRSKMISVGGLALTVATLSWIGLPNPAVLGAAAMIVSEGVELIYLYGVSRRHRLMAAGGDHGNT